MIKIYEEINAVVQPGEVRSDCNSITFVNQGTATISVNAFLTLLPGAQYISQGNVNELNTTSYNIAATTAGTFAVAVIRKFYR